MKKVVKITHIAQASALAMLNCYAFSVQAQAIGDTAPTNETSATDGLGPAEQAVAKVGAEDVQSATDRDQLEDIVVVAQRREERLQRVPITISAITATAVGTLRVVDTSAIQRVTPGIQLTRSGSGGTTFIRGIGNPSGAAGDEGANAYYLDGVYIANLFGNLFSFNNIERIEVLKGPQGTLFGRNASGGVIQVITRDPSTTPTFDGTIGYGNYDNVRATGFIAGPLSDNVRASVAAIYSNQGDGWGKNLFDDKDVWIDKNFGVHGKLVWEPGTDTKVTLSGMHVFSRTDMGPRLRLRKGAVSSVQPSAGYIDFFTVNENGDGLGRRKTDMGTLTLAQSVGFAELTMIAAYQRTANVLRNDIDATPTDYVHGDVHTLNRTWTGEVRLASLPSSRISWVAGLYYLHDNVRQSPSYQYGTSLAPFAFTVLKSEQVTDSYSAFGQATLPIFEGTRVTGGLRYSIDDRDFSGGVDNVAFNGTITPRVPHRTGHARYQSWTWRVALDQDVASGVLAYAYYARGFKSGLFNMNAPQDPPVRPQTVDTVEVGLKSELFDRRLQINVSGFYNWFDDIQLRSVVTAPATRLLNAAKARSRGIDVTVAASPAAGLRVFGGFEVLDAKYQKFTTLFPFTYPRPAVCPSNQFGSSMPGQSSGPPTGGNMTCFGSPDGFDMVQSPHFTGNIGATYEAPTSAGTLLLSANYSYNSGFYWEGDNRIREPSYGLLDGSIGLRFAGDRLTATVWARNITNAHYHTLIASVATGDIATPAAPRTYGIELRVQLGR